MDEKCKWSLRHKLAG